MDDNDCFYDWFCQYKVSIVQEIMLKFVREEAGLGCPPQPFTTNASETTNFILKNKLDYKSHQLLEFVEKLKQLIDDQEKEIEKAVVQRGKYRFIPEYKYLEVPEDHWYKMTPQQQQKHLDALHTPRFKVLEECPLCTHHLRIYHFQSMYMK